MGHEASVVPGLEGTTCICLRQTDEVAFCSHKTSFVIEIRKSARQIFPTRSFL
jgi:hypothetical protein